MKLSFGRDSNNNVFPPTSDTDVTETTTDDSKLDPKPQKDRYFRHEWLNKYSWLRFVENDADGYMYCDICTENKVKCSMAKAAKNTTFQHTTLKRHAGLPEHQRFVNAPILRKDMNLITQKMVSAKDKAVITQLMLVKMQNGRIDFDEAVKFWKSKVDRRLMSFIDFQNLTASDEFN